MLWESFAWNVVTYVKSWILIDYDFKIFPWTYTFFHPLESNLFNYILLCIVLCLYGLFIYFFLNNKKIEKIVFKLATKRTFALIMLFISLISFWYMPQLLVPYRVFVSLSIFTLQFTYLIEIDKKGTLILLIAILFLLLLFEPFNVLINHTYLMNEYADLYGETNIKGELINNKQFLNNINDTDLDTVKTFYDLYSNHMGRKTSSITSDNLDFLNEFNIVNIAPIQGFVLSMNAYNMGSTQKYINNKRNANISSSNEKHDSADPLLVLENLKRIDIEKIKSFYFFNNLEYSHQNMTRGQINHIGHILNPISEYQLGKSLKNIYMQYGLGNTFLLKWTMDVFGGVSLENYYKCYVYYIFYFTLFLMMLFLLFKEKLYVLASFSFLSSHFITKGILVLSLPQEYYLLFISLIS